MDLIQNQIGSDDDLMNHNYYSNGEDDELELDDFTKKRLPRDEDFVVEPAKIKPTKKKSRAKGSSLVDDF